MTVTVGKREEPKKDERKETLSLPPIPRVTAAVPRTENISPFSAKPPPSPTATPLIKDEEKDEPRIFMRKPPLPRQQSSNDDSLNEKVVRYPPFELNSL